MKQVHNYFPDTYLKKIDRLIEKKLYANRNEAIRSGVRDLLILHKVWDNRGILVKKLNIKERLMNTFNYLFNLYMV